MWLVGWLVFKNLAHFSNTPKAQPKSEDDLLENEKNKAVFERFALVSIHNIWKES